MKDLKHLYFLTKIDGLGSVRIKRLLDKFGTAENVFNVGYDELSEIENISRKTALSILDSVNSHIEFENDFDELLSNSEKLNIKILSLTDDDYPDLLKKIYDPPLILYVRGMYDKNNLVNSIGIVGTRKPSDYGKKMSEKFANELSSAGISVISGFARGVDTTAHKAVLANKNAIGLTAAVFGCGVDVIYPSENKKLYEEMLEKGILISEYDISAFPDAVNFPRRNRIISGLSFGTIVIESDINGGALITARSALDQSREVFAIPGYITSKVSHGTNALIKNGQAKLIENIDDILIEIQNKLIGIKTNNNGNPGNEFKISPELSGNEKLIYDAFLMTIEPLHIDEISEKSGLNISDSLVTLLNLEFKNCIEQLPGKRFKIKN